MNGRGLIRRGALGLALAAMLLRALLAPGLMPGPLGAGEGLPVVICTAGTPGLVWLDADGAPVAPPGPGQDHGPCAFAAAPPLAGAPAALALPSPTVNRRAGVPRPDEAQRAAHGRPGALGARAPPVSLSLLASPA